MTIGRQVPWTMDQLALLIRHYGKLALDPLPAKDIAALVRRSRTAIYSMAQRLGLMRSDKMPEKERIPIFELYRAGNSDRDIALLGGHARTTIRKWRKARGLPALGRPGRKRPADLLARGEEKDRASGRR